MRRTFSAVELLTVLAITSVLTALALPAVYEAQLKAKVTELEVNVDGMWDALWAYEAAMDRFPDPAPAYHPNMNSLGKTARSWDPAPDWWSNFGWRPDGDVRGSYRMEVSWSAKVILPSGFIDADGDGEWRWMTRGYYWEEKRSETLTWCDDVEVCY